MPIRHKTTFTPQGEVKKCPKELHAKLRSPHCRVEQSEFEPHNRPKPSPSPSPGPGPGPGPGPVPPFVPGYNPGDGPTPVEPVGPFPPPPPPPAPPGGNGFPYGPVIAGSVVGGIGAGLLARRALQQSMRAQIDPAPEQPSGSIEYQNPEAETGEGDIDNVGADPIEDPTEPLDPTPTTTLTNTPEDVADVGEGAGEGVGEGAGEVGASQVGGGVSSVVSGDVASEGSTAMTTTSLDAGFFSSAAGDVGIPASEEASLLAASGATEEASAAEGIIEAAGEALASADTLADIAAAELVASAGPDEATFGIAGIVAAGVAASVGASASAGIIIAYETSHKRPPSTTALTKNQITKTISNLTGAVVKHPKLQTTLNAVSSAQQDGRPIYNVYNGKKTIVVTQLSQADLLKAKASYHANRNFFKGQDPNVLTAMGLNPDLSKGPITCRFFNKNVKNPPSHIPVTTPTPTSAPTTGTSTPPPATPPPATPAPSTPTNP